MDSKGSSEDNSNEAPVGETGEQEVDLESNLASMMVLVQPILDGLFKAAAENSDYWLKKKSAAVLSDWILSVLNISQLMEQQIQALGATLQAQEKELEASRKVKSKMWVPGI